MDYEWASASDIAAEIYELIYTTLDTQHKNSECARTGDEIESIASRVKEHFLKLMKETE